MLAALMAVMMGSYNPQVLTVPTFQFTSTTSIASFVRHVQHEYGLSNDFYDTLEYESWGWQNIQSTVINKRGVRENSWGIAQIHLDAHPSISKEKALDIEWAVHWAAKEFKAGRHTQWTGWYVVTSRSARLSLPK